MTWTPRTGGCGAVVLCTMLSAGCGCEWYLDLDGDGFGSELQETCTSPGEEWVRRGGDCVDRDPAQDPLSAEIHPDAEEVCDRIDNDCDGVVDGPDAVDALAQTWSDADRDGWGTDPLGPGCAGGDVAPEPGDCDDADADVNPGAFDACSDGADMDCDGADAKGRVTTPRGTVFADLDAALASEEPDLRLCDGEHDWTATVTPPLFRSIYGPRTAVVNLPAVPALDFEPATRFRMSGFTLQGGGTLATGVPSGEINLRSMTVRGARPAVGHGWVESTEPGFTGWVLMADTVVEDIQTSGAGIIDVTASVRGRLVIERGTLRDLHANGAPLFRMEAEDSTMSASATLVDSSADGPVIQATATNIGTVGLALTDPDMGSGAFPVLVDVSGAQVLATVSGVRAPGAMLRAEGERITASVLDSTCGSDNAGLPCVALYDGEREAKLDLIRTTLEGVETSAAGVIMVEGSDYSPRLNIEDSVVRGNTSGVAALVVTPRATVEVTRSDFGTGASDNVPADAAHADESAVVTDWGADTTVECRSGLVDCRAN